MDEGGVKVQALLMSANVRAAMRVGAADNVRHNFILISLLILQSRFELVSDGAFGKLGEIEQMLA